MIPARVKHPLRNVADEPLRQLCFFSDDSCTKFLEEDTAPRTLGQTFPA